MKTMLYIASLFLITGCSANTELTTLKEPVPDQQRESASEGLMISLNQTTFDETPEKIYVTLKNNSQETFSYGRFFQLEYKKDGLWYIVPYSDAVFYRHPDFKNTGKSLKPGETTTQWYSPEKVGIEFPAGDYRLVKSFIHQDPVYNVEISASFHVQ